MRKAKLMKSVCFKAVIILAITFFPLLSSKAQVQQTARSGAMINIPESSVRPRFTLVIPARSRLRAGGPSVAATLQGNGLDRITAVQVLKGNTQARDIEARLGPGGMTTRTVSFSAKSNAASATYRITGISTDTTGSLLFISCADSVTGAIRDQTSNISELSSAMLELVNELTEFDPPSPPQNKGGSYTKESALQAPLTRPLTIYPLPDLTVSKVFFTPNTATVFDRILINVEIANQGNGAAVFPFGKRIWGTIKPNGVVVGPVSNADTIKPGSSVSRSLLLFNTGELKPGFYQIKVVVDPENSVRETNDANNQHLCTLTVFERSWSALFHEAINLAREMRTYARITKLAASIEAELEAGGTIMISAEQYLNCKPINNRAAQTTVESINMRISKIEGLIREMNKLRLTGSFENYDQRSNQLFNMLSTILKTMKEMQSGVARNML